VKQVVNDLKLTREGVFMPPSGYSIGFTMVITSLAYEAHLLRMPTHWIVVGAILPLGLGIPSRVAGTRQKDPAE
jgi:hypothetical protein